MSSENMIAHKKDLSPGAIKITFTGDIMCDADEITAYRNERGQFDFTEIFSGCREYFKHSDYVVGNLETPIADAELSNELYKFNSPAEFAQAVKLAGFSLVSTANNHCLDCGVKGLEDTITILDKVGLKHTGTNREKIIPTGIIETTGNINIGFLSYTYGTNAWLNNNYLSTDEKYKVNLFQEQELSNSCYRNIYNARFSVFFRNIINILSQLLFKKNIICPVWERNETRGPCFYTNIKNDIFELRKKGAEYIVMCLHAGGQYNLKPLNKAKKIVEQMITLGVDAVITNHEHCVHTCKVDQDKIKAYSLGNFTSRNGVQTTPYDKMAEYSILFNLYLQKKDGKTPKVPHTTFTIVKSISIGPGKVKTVLLYDLIVNCHDVNERNKLISDNLKIYNIFKDTKETEIELKLEYPF